MLDSRLRGHSRGLPRPTRFPACAGKTAGGWIPACAGKTAVGGFPACAGKTAGGWIPACAGKTAGGWIPGLCGKDGSGWIPGLCGKDGSGWIPGLCGKDGRWVDSRPARERRQVGGFPACAGTHGIRGRGRPRAGFETRLQQVQVLQAAAGIEQHDAFRCSDAARSQQLAEGRQRRSALRAGKDALG